MIMVVLIIRTASFVTVVFRSCLIWHESPCFFHSWTQSHHFVKPFFICLLLFVILGLNTFVYQKKFFRALVDSPYHLIEVGVEGGVFLLWRLATCFCFSKQIIVNDYNFFTNE